MSVKRQADLESLREMCLKGMSHEHKGVYVFGFPLTDNRRVRPFFSSNVPGVLRWKPEEDRIEPLEFTAESWPGITTRLEAKCIVRVSLGHECQELGVALVTAFPMARHELKESVIESASASFSEFCKQAGGVLLSHQIRSDMTAAKDLRAVWLTTMFAELFGTSFSKFSRGAFRIRNP